MERFRHIHEQLTVLEADKVKRLANSKALERLALAVESRPLVLEAFDKKLWLAIVDQVRVGTDGDMRFQFRNGMDINLRLMRLT